MPLFHHDHSLCGCRRAASSGFASAGAPKHYPPDLRIEPVHLDIDLAIDVDNESAKGIVTHTLAVRSDGARELRLNAVDLDISEVVDVGGAEVSWRHDGEHLDITWAEGLKRNEQRKLAIHYSVSHPRAGLFFSHPTENDPNAARWAATDHETERARHWLPCVDFPQVRCRLDFHLRADESFIILANGEQVAEDRHGDGTKTIHWQLNWPCPSYITCFALGEFTQAEDGEFEGRPIEYFAAKHHTAEDLVRSFGRTGDMLTWITEKLDQRFPYPKYFQFALPGIGGAMENISLVSWDEIFVMDETLAEEFTWLVDQVNIHEMAHSYFGDAIVCRHFTHAWLKESWATYMESCWLEHRHGDDELGYDFYRNREAYFSEADNNYKRPIVTNKYDTSWQMYDRHLYPGGAARLHMLRKWLGDDVFWEGVRAYVAQNMGKAVETSDFRHALEDASGRSLVQWFEQWIHSPGYPAIKASFSWNEKQKKGTFTIEQTQVKEDGDEPTFVMEFDLGWRIDGEDHKRTFQVDQAKHQFTIDMPSKPEFVRVDPDNRLVIKLDFNPGDDMLQAQLTGAKDVIGRILAGRELAKTNKRANIEAIRDAYADESFWGVRQAWSSALGNCATQPALEVLLELSRTEKDPLVLESFLRALTSYQDDAVKTRLEELIAEGLPYRARQVAYEALGSYKGEGVRELLTEAAATPTFTEWPQRGALFGLANSRSEQVYEILADATRPAPESGRTHKVRAHAARALGVLTRYLDERHEESTRELLVAMLRDENSAARAGAADGLLAARAKGAASALRAYKKTLSHQDQVGMEERITAMLQAKDPKLGELEGKFDQLQKDYRSLLEKVSKLEAQSKEKDANA